MLAQTVEREVAAFVAAYEHITDEGGRRMVIRNGYLPERTIQIGLLVPAVVAGGRDRRGVAHEVLHGYQINAPDPIFLWRKSCVGRGQRRYRTELA